MTEVFELQCAQGDVVRAVRMIVFNRLSLDTPGAIECERLIREFGEGNRALWDHSSYLRTSIYMAQAIVEVVRETIQENIDA
jgi:hypothetical protein